MKIRKLAAVSLACAALLGCESGFAPELSERYSLHPPAVLENEVVRIEILSETLSLYEDGTARREYRQHLDYASGAAARDTTLDAAERYTYEVEGSRIELAAICPPNALCVPPPHIWGTVTDAGLELHSHFDPDAVLTYRRVAP